MVLCSLEISRIVCRKRSCSAIGSLLIIAAACTIFRSLKFALGVDDLCAAFALGFRLLGHRALHGVGQRNILDLNRRDFDAPRFGLPVDDLLQFLVDRLALRKQVIQGA
ncbi:MAG: hypothetical protein Udaeo2_01290 [Candidatus Udaeobacter sp.]|nr:MAG: hypothetical protein Udaeo2_01290 [Candidatus Udaeobacter sp.]